MAQSVDGYDSRTATLQGQLKTRMDKAVEDFRKEMASTRTGRASVSMLDSVVVEAYGSICR